MPSSHHPNFPGLLLSPPPISLGMGGAGKQLFGFPKQVLGLFGVFWDKTLAMGQGEGEGWKFCSQITKVSKMGPKTGGDIVEGTLVLGGGISSGTFITGGGIALGTILWDGEKRWDMGMGHGDTRHRDGTRGHGDRMGHGDGIRGDAGHGDGTRGHGTRGQGWDMGMGHGDTRMGTTRCAGGIRTGTSPWVAARGRGQPQTESIPNKGAPAVTVTMVMMMMVMMVMKVTMVTVTAAVAAGAGRVKAAFIPSTRIPELTWMLPGLIAFPEPSAPAEMGKKQQIAPRWASTGLIGMATGGGEDVQGCGWEKRKKKKVP